MTGERLVGGRYRLLASLGRGGMGIVWRAHDQTIGREVAVKQVLFPPELPPAERAGLRERTLREARSAARIRHPAVVAVHDVIEDGGEPWIVMELIRGRSLDQVIKTGGAMSPQWAASVGLFVLSALANAHMQGVLHRDVKPGNVLLADDGRILLSDFGIATQTGGPSSGAPMGTPGFTAPECLTPTSGQPPGPPSDLWSLAATVYTAVEGVSPYQRPSAVATLGAVMTEPPRPPQRAGPQLGPLLVAALSQNPARRPDLPALRQGLQQVIGQTAATVASPGPMPDWLVPRNAAYGSAAAVVLAFVTSLILVLTTSSAPAAVRPPAPASADVAKPAPVATPTAAATPSAAGPTFSPAPTQAPGKFDAVPRPCQLLTEQQAKEIFGAYRTTLHNVRDEDPPLCSWSSTDYKGTKEHSMFLKLHLYKQQGDGYENTLAEEHVAGGRTAAEELAGRGGAGAKNSDVFDVGAGDGGAGWEVAEKTFSRQKFTVHMLFRTGNMVCEMRMEREVASDPKLREKAVKAAEYIAENLDREA
ncbi:serine/threonine-protein kinase [Streptosporangium sp. KLBMP 9127]|nr:serine/threonine protein kinase [Streptosporangium sp. KLBMP 9127]